MNHTVLKTSTVAAAMPALSAGSIANAQTKTVDTRVGKLMFELGVPTKESVTKLYDEIDFQRACQAYIWSLPLVASKQLRRANEINAGARDGDFRHLHGLQRHQRLPDAKPPHPLRLHLLEPRREWTDRV